MTILKEWKMMIENCFQFQFKICAKMKKKLRQAKYLSIWKENERRKKWIKIEIHCFFELFLSILSELCILNPELLTNKTITICCRRIKLGWRCGNLCECDIYFESYCFLAIRNLCVNWNEFEIEYSRNQTHI